MASKFTVDLNGTPVTKEAIDAELSAYCIAGQLELDLAQKRAFVNKCIHTGIFLLVAVGVWIGATDINNKIFYWCFLALFVGLSVAWQNQCVIDQRKAFEDGKKKYFEVAPVSRLNDRILELSKKHDAIRQYINAVAGQGRLLIKTEFYAFIHFDDRSHKAASAREIYSDSCHTPALTFTTTPIKRKVSF